MKHHTSTITLDENALLHNFQRIRALAPHSKILAMVKANAYGHGIVKIAKTLSDADAFGVACFAEALKLRDAEINNRIVLMRGVFNREELQLAQQNAIELVVHQFDQIVLLENNIPQKPLVIWLKINTGMNRLGFLPSQFKEAYQRLVKIHNIKEIILLTHFASADDLASSVTEKQINQFTNIANDFTGEKSLANSAGILAWPQSHADWVRPGIMLYGVSPFHGTIAADYNLLPVMNWHSELIAVRQQYAGDVIGYCGTWMCPEDMLIGIVGVGYADGFPRHAQNGTPVLVNNKSVPIIGRVSMDMLAVDLRSQPAAKVGDDVILWGQGLPIEEVAKHTATSPYELLCNVHLRSK